MALILYLGGARFGRDGSQAMIDRWGRGPRLGAWLNRHHGALRAGFHYVEFVTLAVLLYMALGWALETPPIGRMAMAWAAAAGWAWVDEYRQSLTPGRMFRRIDFLHSLAGTTIGALGAAIVELAL